ncbi:MAG: glycosyltransferase [Chitinophagaceae bacterium]|nr:glycosyltransferase [Chitinophagaceae bacterium]
MILSIVIINYNVKHFLEQCLLTVEKALKDIESEIIVVDNNSRDHSLVYLEPYFPEIKFVSNKENIGFAKACNQGMALSSGQYILFLNPDCLIPEDSLGTCLRFFNNHRDAGAIGIRMLDGHGFFLKESKRAFPSPITSFFKLMGFARLFPHSKIFARYHLGHLDADSNQVVDVLAGAFMMVRRDVLETTGGFDEIFFMYGEDVDLSYRIQKAGFKNYYLAETEVIHFKGESTKKGSLNYVRMFYNAMRIFVKKHYGGSKAGVFNFFIHFAILLRAGLATVNRFLRWLGLPLIDAILILFSFIAVKKLWTNVVRVDIDYPEGLLWIAFPAFTALYLLTSYYAGLYDKFYKRSELVSSLLIATLVLLSSYSLLPEAFRFSRGIVLFGALLAFVLLSFLRWFLIANGYIIRVQESGHPEVLVVGSFSEYEQVLELLANTDRREKVLGRVAVIKGDATGIGSWHTIGKLFPSVPAKEIIFCIGHMTIREIMHVLPQIPAHVRIKYHVAGSRSIVGSDSQNISGESLSLENEYKISSPYNQRLKRLIDGFTALIFLFSFPFHIIFHKKRWNFLRNCIAVLIGYKTWVGYTVSNNRLPALRPSVIGSNGVPHTQQQPLPAESLQKIDEWYTRNYEPIKDLKLIVQHYTELGG